MREEMKERDEARRLQFRKEGWPYFAYRCGEKSRGITRIGKWEKTSSYFDKEKAKRVTKTEKHNTTPKKMQVLLKTYRHDCDAWMLEMHLYLKPLPESEQAEWRLAFPDAVIDEE